MTTNEQDGTDEADTPRDPGERRPDQAPDAQAPDGQAPTGPEPRDAAPDAGEPSDARPGATMRLKAAGAGASDGASDGVRPSGATAGSPAPSDAVPSPAGSPEAALSEAGPSEPALSEAGPSDSGSSEARLSDSGSSASRPSVSGSSEGRPSASGSSDARLSDSGSSASRPSVSGSSEARPSASGSSEGRPSASGSSDARPSDPGSSDSGPSGAARPTAAADFLLAEPAEPPQRPEPPAGGGAFAPPAPLVPPPAPPARAAEPYAPAGTSFPPPPPAPPAPPASAAVPPSPYGPVEYLGSTPLTADGQPVAAGPADAVRAVAVALLNLSGLGLGYALLRRWAGLAVCLAATAALLVAALPADPDGVSGKVVAAYAVLLVAAAVHGALSGLRRPLSWPAKSPVAAVLGLVLLAVPVGGAVLYKGAQDEATQKMLLDRLHTADHLVQVSRTRPFDAAKPDYAKALAAYRDLYDHHAGSRAAKRVPASLATYYTAVGAAYDQKKYCDAVEPLQYLRTVPAHFDKKALGQLTGWPDDRLATSLYECGAQSLDESPSSPTAETDFTQLLTTFPTSPQAAKVEPAYRAAIDQAAQALNGSDPCTATDTIRELDGSLTGLPGRQAGMADAFAKDIKRAGGYMESGTYACAVHQYKGGHFGDAQTTINAFVTRYPHDSHVALAKKIAIAAQIALHDPAAGKHLPTLDSGGSIPVTFTNDSPDAVQVLFTGPVTGSITIRGCSDCKVYDSEADAGPHACKSSGKDYGKKTLHLPAGTTYFLNKPVGISSTTPASHTSTLQYDYEYTECAYTVKRDYGL
ncbi:hypothetical protein [Streptomyces sp. HPF1205]|uniref:hypothetical protein n=1 Tax=Streptomyces sp. HPF1205 TaxID=2873262 RepID=UPI001CEDDE65|nr:hypothetical protein [Streptomyces sp. HPF1205]